MKALSNIPDREQFSRIAIIPDREVMTADELGKTIRAARRRLQLTQEELAAPEPQP
jgi:ribosome-binding protein aMBF1 (putative translation factor)